MLLKLFWNWTNHLYLPTHISLTLRGAWQRVTVSSYSKLFMLYFNNLPTCLYYSFFWAFAFWQLVTCFGLFCLRGLTHAWIICTPALWFTLIWFSFRILCHRFLFDLSNWTHIWFELNRQRSVISLCPQFLVLWNLKVDVLGSYIWAGTRSFWWCTWTRGFSSEEFCCSEQAVGFFASWTFFSLCRGAQYFDFDSHYFVPMESQINKWYAGK